MRIERYVAEVHYPIVYNWWKAQTGRTLDPTQISDDGALVIADDGRPVCASWIIVGNGTRMAHMGFTVADPKAGPREKIYCVEFLIQYMIARARELGMRHIVSNSDRPGLTKLFQRAGFQTMDPHVTMTLQLEGTYGDKEIF